MAFLNFILWLPLLVLAGVEKPMQWFFLLGKNLRFLRLPFLFLYYVGAIWTMDLSTEYLLLVLPMIPIVYLRF